MGQHPAFQFYWADYLIGTKTMTAAERGVYVDCLCHQWDTGSVPGDDMRDIALVMRVSEREARQLWQRVSTKFTRGDDGLWRNGRLELERTKQADYRSKRASAGQAGGLAKAKQEASKEPGRPLAKSYPPSPSPSPVSSSKNDDERASRGPGLVMTSAEYARKRDSHRHIGVRLHVPNVLHRELVAKLGGVDPDVALVNWYAVLDAELESSGEPIPDVFKWLRVRFETWVGAAAEAAEWAKWAPGGAIDKGQAS